MHDWIDVNERLPESGVDVLVWYGEWIVGPRINIMHRAWSYGRFYDHDGCSCGIQPTHWMPLPEPPKETK